MGLEENLQSNTFFRRLGSHERFITPTRVRSIGTLHWLNNIFIATCIIRIRNKSICGLDHMVTSWNFSTADEIWKRVCKYGCSWFLTKLRLHLHFCPFVSVCLWNFALMHTFNSFSPLTHLPAAGDEDTSNSGTSHLDCLHQTPQKKRSRGLVWAPQKVDGNRLRYEPPPE